MTIPNMLAGVLIALLGAAETPEGPAVKTSPPDAVRVELSWQRAKVAHAKQARIDEALARRGIVRIEAPALPPLVAFPDPQGRWRIEHRQP